MALDAQIIRSCIRQHIFIISPMGPVACETLYEEISVSLVDIFFTYGVGGMFLPVMTAPAEIDNG